MFKDFEALGVLDMVQDQLLIDDEGLQRLLDYGETVLDQFPGEEPGPAWEPTPTSTGQVESYRTEDGTEAQSVSKRASAPAPVAGTSSVPGLGVHAPDYKPPEVRMVRRIFVVTEDEGKLIDSVLGMEAAPRLVQLCEALSSGKLKFEFEQPEGGE